ncbi:MAG: hypothetical protein AAGI92_05815 [Pseudomonadota bacterium]
MNAYLATVICAGALLIGGLVLLAVGAPNPFLVSICGLLGFALLSCAPGVKAENKTVAHAAVMIVLVVLLGSLWYFFTGLQQGNTVLAAIAGIIAADAVLAKVFFIKSFRDARKAREAAQ